MFYLVGTKNESLGGSNLGQSIITKPYLLNTRYATFFISIFLILISIFSLSLPPESSKLFSSLWKLKMMPCGKTLETLRSQEVSEHDKRLKN